MLKFPDKAPTDELLREFNWTKWLAADDAILTDPAPVFAVSRKDGAAMTSDDITASGAIVRGKSAVCLIKGGKPGVTYLIACTIETDDGETVTRHAQQGVKAKL